jgi:hypothetical protein
MRPGFHGPVANSHGTVHKSDLASLMQDVDSFWPDHVGRGSIEETMQDSHDYHDTIPSPPS